MVSISLGRRQKTEVVDKNDYYTGEKDKILFVHPMQGNIQIDKPIKTLIHKQSIEWRGRVFPISPSDFIIDDKGIHHQYQNANDTRPMALGNYTDKPIELKCRDCGGQLARPMDSRNVRSVIKRGTIQAIWGIDSTHLIILLFAMIGVLAGIGYAVYESQQLATLQAKVDSALASQSLKPLAPTSQQQTVDQQLDSGTGTKTVIVK